MSTGRRVPGAAWWLLASWMIITAAAAWWAIEHQEASLRERAGAALAGQPVAVDFSGRDASLTGVVEDQAVLDRAVATVRAVEGVRRVDSSRVALLPPPNVPPAESQPPRLIVTVAEGTAVLEGSLPSEPAAAALLQAATTRWGADNVVDRIQVGVTTTGASWLAGMVAAVDSLSAARAAGLAFGPTGVVLTGEVADQSVATTIEEAVASALDPRIPFVAELSVVPLEAPSLAAELLADGRIRLRGVMPSQAAIDAIVAAAAGVHGSASIVDEMVVGQGIAEPAYLDALPGVFGAIDGVQPWRVDVSQAIATIEGRAVSQDAIDTTAARLGFVLGGAGLDFISRVVIDDAAVATVLTELLEGTATFRVGSSSLSAEATDLLDEAIDILRANPTTVLVVEGHTDDVGSEADNLRLSEARAEAVVDYLVSGGIDAGRLEAVGFGETQPIADNGTAEGRAQNRRIEFVVGGDR